MDMNLDKTMLEPEFIEPYRQWKATPTPELNASFLKTLDPVIDKAIKTHVGMTNPLLKSQARKLALQGLRTYNPNRSRLQTHLYNQIHSLKRYNAQHAQSIHVPERVVLDKRALDMATQELLDNLGRDATDEELSEYTGFSPRRLKHVRRYRPAMAEGYFAGRAEQDSDEGGFAPGVDQPTSQAWLQLVYDDLDPVDKKIMEYTLGMNGQPRLSNQEIARKLNRTPGAISQRKLRIQTMLDREDDLSPFGQ